MMDSSKPLSILSHVGGTPLLMIASHSKNGLDDYVKIVDWLKRVAGHVEQSPRRKRIPMIGRSIKKSADRGSSCSNG